MRSCPRSAYAFRDADDAKSGTPGYLGPDVEDEASFAHVRATTPPCVVLELRNEVGSVCAT